MRQHRVTLTCLAGFALLLSTTRLPAAGDEAEADSGAAGLVARFTSAGEPGSGQIHVERVEPLPRLFGRPNETPDDALPAGSFTAEWQGLLLVPYGSEYTFTALRNTLGEFKLSVGGRSVELGKPVELPSGPATFQLTGKQSAGELALDLWWRSGSFADEPIDARFFRHDPAMAHDAARVAVRRDAGGVLANSHGCFRCHAGPDGWAEPLAADLPREAVLPGPRLNDLGRRVQSKWLLAWLQNPAAWQPHAAMPALFGNQPADDLGLRAITTFLSSSGTGLDPLPASANAQRGAELYGRAGCAACHAEPKDRPRLPDPLSAVPSIENLSAKWQPQGLADFLAAPLASRSHGRMPDYRFTAEEAADLAAWLLARPATQPPISAAVRPLEQAELATLWRAQGGNAEQFKGRSAQQQLAAAAVREMAARQCFDCHDLQFDGLKIDRRATGPAQVIFGGESWSPKDRANRSFTGLPPAALQRGCLAAPGKPNSAPRFDLSPDERSDLRQYLSSLGAAPSASSMSRLRADLAALNCLRCHDNEGQGGQSLAAVVDQGDATRYLLPPMLTRAAGRIRPARIDQFVTSGASELGLRPWTAARMPGFGIHGKRLADGLKMRDQVAGPAVAAGPTVPGIPQPEVHAGLAELGRGLVGTKALACLNCHPLHGKLLAGQPDPTTRGPDLTLVAEHLQPDYFYRWIMNPARVRPGTKMPQAIAADGRVPLAGLASHAPGTAMNALWTYLSQGASLKAPADDTTVKVVPQFGQPVVQRGDITVHGRTRLTRGAALGFTDGTLLFDPDQLAPAAVWFGGFVESKDSAYFGQLWYQQGKPEEADSWPARPHPLQVRLSPAAPWQTTALPLESDPNTGARFLGYQTGQTSVRLRYRLLIENLPVEVTEDVRVEARPAWRGVARHFRVHGLPAGATVALRLPPGESFELLQADGAPASDDGSASAPLAFYRGDKNRAVRVAQSLGGGWLDLPPEAGKTVKAPVRAWSSAAAVAGKPLELRADCWIYHGKSPVPAADELASLHVQPPILRDDLDRPAAPAPLPAVVEAPSPAVVVDKNRPQRVAVAPNGNVEEFPLAKARFLRFTVSRTQDNTAPGIDELEVFGVDPKLNLALGGRATASSVITGHKIHQIAHLNDGILGNDHSWISGEAGKGWAQIEFPAPVEVSKVVWARDRNGICKDRLAVGYQVDLSMDGQRWTKVIDSSDRLGSPAPGTVSGGASPGYELESIPLPFAGCRPSDVAFGPDGSLYLIAMTEGQVWRTRRPPVDHPEQVRWQRYASGLYHPIGLAIVDGRLYVAQKPEITELIDRDGDGMVDQYRTVATGWGLSTGWHEYTFGLAVDPQKNLWFALNTGYFWTNPGYVNPGRFRGSVMRVDYGTEKLSEVAKGCRVPNGIGRGTNGDIFYTDNQGDWIQSCKLAAVVPGRFYGHPEYKEDALPEGKYPDGRVAVWLPYHRSRSSSGPVHDDTAGKFGPFADQMFVGDAGFGANPGILRVALEKVDGEYQGAVFRFIDDQPHGCVRMKFGPDNELYMACLTTGLVRLRFDGSLPFAMHSIRIRPRGAGFSVRLTRPVAADVNIQAADVHVKRFHYLYTGNYGSPNADEKSVPVAAAELSADRMTLNLTLPVETYPIGMVYELNLGNLKGDNGQPLVHNEAWYTVHRIPQ